MNRTKEEKQVKLGKDVKASDEVIPQPIKDLNDRNTKTCRDSPRCLTTNESLKSFIKSSNGADLDVGGINQKLIDIINEEELLKISLKNITLYSQGKINGNFATSFEEAIILSNCVDNDDELKNKKSLIKLLGKVRSRTPYFSDIDSEFDMIDYSYMYQVKLSDGKAKFSSQLVFLDNPKEDQDFEIKIPKYIEEGLDELKKYFMEGIHGKIY